MADRERRIIRTMSPVPVLCGLFPPVPTPFTVTGDLDLPALQVLLRALAPEVDGFVLLGSNGEAIYLSEAERCEVLRAAKAAIPAGKLLIAGTGGEATRQVIDRHERAAELGADYALVLPPHYYQGQMTDEALARHYRAVAEASPLPIPLYNFPANTTISLSPALVEKLATVDKVVGLKDSSGNIGALTEIVRRVPESFAVITGNAPTLLPALTLGAKGAILAVANVAPRPYRGIMQLFANGQLTQARALQLRYNPLALAVTNRYGVAGLKAALRLRGLPAGYPRTPLLDLTAEQQSELATLLASLEDLVQPTSLLDAPR